EIRALGELGRLEEMVQTYRGAERWLVPSKRHECLLFVCAFTGRLGCVEHLLGRALRILGDELKAYWIAVTRLRRDRQDSAARTTLQGWVANGLDARVRRSAARELERAEQAGPPLPPLTPETERLIDALGEGRGQRRPPLLRWNWKAHVNGLVLLILIV